MATLHEILPHILKRLSPNRFRCHAHIILFCLITTTLVGCQTVGGTVSTINYSAPPDPAAFYVIPFSPSVTDHHISALIETRLTQLGLQKATAPGAANVGVIYAYSADANGSIESAPDPAFGGHAVYTTFPRTFRIALFDIHASDANRLAFLWQGEIYSVGQSRNFGDLAPYFVNALFNNYGQTVSNKRWGEVVMAPPSIPSNSSTNHPVIPPPSTR